MVGGQGRLWLVAVLSLDGQGFPSHVMHVLHHNLLALGGLGSVLSSSLSTGELIYKSTSLVLLALNLHFLCLLVQHCTSETWFKECLAQLKCLKFIHRVLRSALPVRHLNSILLLLTIRDSDYRWGIDKATDESCLGYRGHSDGGRVHGSTWTCNLTVDDCSWYSRWGQPKRNKSAAYYNCRCARYARIRLEGLGLSFEQCGTYVMSSGR